MDIQQNERKRVFNKKEYRQHRYKSNFGNKQEGRGKAFLQKNAVVRQYHWMQKKEEKKLKKLEKQKHIEEGNSNDEAEETEPSTSSHLSTVNSDETDVFSELGKPKKKKLYSWQRAKLEYKKKVAEREQKKEEAVRRKEEMQIARKKYKEKKLHRYKKLSKKNNRGQPLMSGRIELMLEKLMEEKNSK
ncbi:thyroid transcription factor 1-associated protein 26 homolog [Penaeus indicus]|uniref:thyroid transcription factor 1-associated protein 26 homolog n=1 Tax=Penaeus indicus TaxID=29960 RepID=UPI00300C8F89